MKSLFKAQVPNNDDLLTESKQALSLIKQDVLHFFDHANLMFIKQNSSFPHKPTVPAVQGMHTLTWQVDSKILHVFLKI